LVGVNQLVRQVLLGSIFAHLDPGPSDYSWVVGDWLGLHAEELSKKYQVGLDPQECFTEVDEDRYMEDSIGVQVEVLDTVIAEKTFEEVARRKSQPALYESGEHRDLVGVLLHRIRIPGGGTPHVHLFFPKETTVEQR
jgi:hypothetical protein